MTLRRAIIAALLLPVVGFFVWRQVRDDHDALPPSSRSPASSGTVAAPSAAPGSHPTSRPPERSPLADALNSPDTDIRADLKLVLEIVETFRSNFLQTGNPVGSNAEITAALTGRNRLRLSLIPADHPAINPDGELCDRWGTPFFFHAESATRMEIRSAGPDRKMWSADDVVLTP